MKPAPAVGSRSDSIRVLRPSLIVQDGIRSWDLVVMEPKRYSMSHRAMSGSSVLELLVMLEAGQRVGVVFKLCPWAWNHVLRGR